MWRNEMIRVAFILFMLVSYAVSDKCVTYTFEEDFDEWPTHEQGSADCKNMPDWILRKYSDFDLSHENEGSMFFITPQTDLSCVSSFIFTMNYNGTIEAKIYMAPTDIFDQIIILVYMLDSDGDRVTGQVFNMAVDPNFEEGWITLRETLTGSAKYEGYVSFNIVLLIYYLYSV